MTNAFENNQVINISKLSLTNVLGKDLHNFAANVEEWSMFISLFKRSTETCGYNDEENMICLQKVLKHEDFKAAKSFIVSPDYLKCIL